MSSISEAHPHEHKAGGHGMFLALIPWVLFTVLAEHASLKLGACAALVGAIGVAMPGLIARRPKLLEFGAVATFAVFAVVAFKVDHHTATIIARYGRAFAAGALAIVVFATLPLMPFTEQYARESVPEEYWHSPRFRAVNRKLSAMWGCVFLAMIPCHIAAGAINQHKTNILFNWVIPGMLVLWAAKRSTGAAPQAPAA